MPAKYLHFEKAFLPDAWAKGAGDRVAEGLIREIVRGPEGKSGVALYRIGSPETVLDDGPLPIQAIRLRRGRNNS
jgi:hypothetical protein